MSHRAAWAFAAVLSAAVSACAAEGAVAGKIIESDGNASGFAQITMLDRNSGVSRVFTADAGGVYRASAVPPGSYNLTVRSPRTRAFISLPLELHGGEDIVLPLRLSGQWTVFDILKPSSIPLANGYLEALRDGSEITRGEAGGNIEGYGPYSPRGNFGVNSLGQRSQDNNFQVDGMDNNDPWLRGPILNPSPDAIESVSLTSVYTPASEGHQAGAVIDVSTPSGTSFRHGSAFDYLRNSALDSRNFFDGAAKPGTVRNDFGGSAGGPVAGKDWFFFANVDALRARDGLTVISTVPTAAEKSGNFGARPIYNPLSITQTDIITFFRLPYALNQVPQSMISPQARNILELYPDPNLPGLTSNFRYTPSAINNGERYALRTDKALSSRYKLFARLNYERHASQSPSALPGVAAADSTQHADAGNIHIAATGAAFGFTSTIRPDVANEIRLGFTAFDWTGAPADQSSFDAAPLGIPGLTSGGLPVVSPEGYAQLGAAQGLPAHTRSASYELKDSVSWKMGRHSIVAGLQTLNRRLDGDATDYTSRGTFSFTPDYTDLPNTPGTGNSIASLLTGDPSEIRRDIQLQPYRLRGLELAGFVQDTLRISRKLLVTAGIRYSYNPPVSEADNRMVNFNYSRTDPALDQFAGLNGVNSYGGLSFNKRTIAPRIGFALDLDSDGSTVLRGGFSQDYDPGSYMAEGALARNAPYESRLDLFNGSLQMGPSLAGGLPAPSFAPLTSAASLNAAQTAIYAIEPKNYTPYADQWGLFLDRRLTGRLTVELSGAGSMGIHLYQSYNINEPFPAPTPYPFQRYPYPPYTSRIEYLGFAAGSTYYGGEAKLTGQLRSDLHIVATYRYAKSIDDSTAPETPQESRPAGPQFSYDLRGSRSVSAFDVPRRAIVGATYNLPLRSSAHAHAVESLLGDWRLDTLITLQSGFPFTPQLAIDGLNNGDFQLPDRVGSGALPANERSVTQWFNTSVNGPNAAFVVPALFQYGNSGFDILRGPGLATVDAALSRTFTIRERLHFQTRIEATNLSNRTNLGLPNAILGIDASGAISHTSTPPRNMQLVARLNW